MWSSLRIFKTLMGVEPIQAALQAAAIPYDSSVMLSRDDSRGTRDTHVCTCAVSVPRPFNHTSADGPSAHCLRQRHCPIKGQTRPPGSGLILLSGKAFVSTSVRIRTPCRRFGSCLLSQERHSCKSPGPARVIRQWSELAEHTMPFIAGVRPSTIPAVPRSSTPR